MKERFSRIKISFLPVVVLVFSLLGYGPAELWVSNRGSEEMWFSFNDVLLPLILLGVGSFIIVMGLLIALPDKGFRVVLGIVVALDVLIFLQGFFLPNGYGSLNGAEIDWSQYTVRLIYNTTIWIAAIVLAIILAVKKWNDFKTAASFVAVLLLMIQGASLVTVGLTSGGKPQSANTADVFLTTEKKYTVSGGDNTIVFILDAFDSQLMCDLLEQHSDELRDSFADFTFYHNTSGGATRTKYAIPYILTGRTNDTEDTYTYYLGDSFKTSPLFQELRTGKYDTGFYTEWAYIDRTQSVAIDNLSSGAMLKPTSEWGLAGSLLKMTAFKYMPHIAKPVFWMYSFELSQWKGGSQGSTPHKTDDVAFHDTLLADGLSVEGSEPGFRFIHLNGAHGPFVMDENMHRITDGYGTEDKQGLGALRIVADYIRLLKQIDAYDNASIFIMADHGDKVYVAGSYEQNPLFMVKKPYDNHEFIASDIRLSYKNVSEMLADAIRGDLEIEGRYLAEGTRYFYIGAESNNDYSIVELASEENAYDNDSWHMTGKNFVYNGSLDFNYQMGVTLYFGEQNGATMKKHCVSGFTYPETSFVWSNGKEAEIRFDIGSVDKNILMEFNFISAMNNAQRCYIYAGDEMFASFLAQKASKVSFLIPKEAVIEGILNIRFILPDAYSPLEHGTGVDARQLGIAFNSMTLTLTDDPVDIESQKGIKDLSQASITFGPDADNSGCEISGISADHWTSGEKATILFPSFKSESDLTLSMSYKTYGDQQHVIIYANGEQIADYIASQYENKEFTIPASCLKNDMLRLEFELPDAFQPDNGDKRKLALWMEKLTIYEAGSEPSEAA